MAKKKLKLRKSRHKHPLSSQPLFRKKEDLQLMWMDWSIRQAFPDPVKRQEYIRALIKGLEEEKSCEII